MLQRTSSEQMFTRSSSTESCSLPGSERISLSQHAKETRFSRNPSTSSSSSSKLSSVPLTLTLSSEFRTVRMKSITSRNTDSGSSPTVGTTFSRNSLSRGHI
uniref:(northern house mosquito) hypothetical protein n=1 Tax=Culex pipiens TaxID=7175 RepID=A0A8D8HTI3_CULPI